MSHTDALVKEAFIHPPKNALIEGRGYLGLALAMFIIASLLGLFLQIELFRPGHQYLSPGQFAQVISLHIELMMQGALFPALVGLALYKIREMTMATSSVYPMLSRIGFWVLCAGIVLICFNIGLYGAHSESLNTTRSPALGSRDGLSVPVMWWRSVGALLLNGGLLLNMINIFVSILQRRTDTEGMRNKGKSLSLMAWSYGLFSLVLAIVLIQVLFIALWPGNGFSLTKGTYVSVGFYTAAPWYSVLPVKLALAVLSIGIMLQLVFDIYQKTVAAGFHKTVLGVLAILGTGLWLWQNIEGGANVAFIPASATLSQMMTGFMGLLSIYTAFTLVFLLFLIMKTKSRDSIGRVCLAAGIIMSLLALVIGWETFIGGAIHILDSTVVTAHLHLALIGGFLFSFLVFGFRSDNRCSSESYWPKYVYRHVWMIMVLTSVGFGGYYLMGKYGGLPRLLSDYSMDFADTMYATSMVLFSLFSVLMSFLGVTFVRNRNQQQTCENVEQVLHERTESDRPPKKQPGQY